MWQLPLKVKLPFFKHVIGRKIWAQSWAGSPDEVGLFLRQGEAIITKKIRLKAPVCKLSVYSHSTAMSRKALMSLSYRDCNRSRAV